MKSRTTSTLRFAAALALVCAASAHAVDYTWDGGTGNWNATNWNGGTASGPTTAGNTATITGGTVNANVGGPGVLDSLIIGSGGQLNVGNNTDAGFPYMYLPNLNLQGGTLSGAYYYNAYGAAILGNVTVSGSAASTITGSSFFNINPTTTFTVADVTGSSATDLLVNTHLRGPAGSPDWTYNDASFIKEGAGTMEVTVHSHFRGPATINGGTLKLADQGGYGYFASSVTVNSGATLETYGDGTGLGWQGGWKPTSVNINGGTITTAGTSHIWQISGGVNMTGGTLQSNGGVSDANGGQLEWNQTNLNTNASADTATIGGRIRIRADGGYSGIAFTVADGAAATDLLVSAAVTEASSGMGITKAGSGTMVLSGANNYTGGTNVNEGTLTFANTSAKSSGSTTTVAAGATLGLGVGGSGFFGEADVTSLFGNTMTNVSMNATSNVGVDTSAGNFSYTAAASGSLGLVKLGSNTLTLTAINSYSGGTIVNNGTLELNSTSFDQSVIRGALTVNSGATVNITGYDYAGLGRINSANVTTLNVNGGTVNTSVESWLTGATVNLTGGTMNGTGRHQIISSSLNSKASATTSVISSNLLVRKDYGSSDLAIDVENGAAATDLLISGNIGEVLTAGVSKTGLGTLELTGTNTYDGTTTVSGGKLLINGDNSAANGAVTVASGATLGGSGPVGGATTIQSGGHLAVGNSVGTQTFNSSLTFDSGSIFDWDIDTSSTSSGFDTVSVTGNIDVASGAIFKVMLGGTALTDIQNTSNAFWNTPFGTQTWNMTSIFGEAFNSGAFTSVQTSTDVSSYGSFTINGSSLTWTAVPEPTSALAGLLLGAGLLRRRRRVA